MKAILIKISLFIFIVANAPVVWAQDNKDNPHIFISDNQTMPSYPGGEKEMYKFIADRLVYPQAALDAKIEGRVTLRFVVSADGYIQDVTVLRGIHPECDSLAVNIVWAMPKWNAGKSNGKNVRIYFTLPIRFRLPEDPKTEVCINPEKVAMFKGGDAAMWNFIAANLKYPIRACEMSLPQGRVIVQFIVSKTGKVESPIVFKSLDPDLDKEAIRVIGMMPDWIPAEQNGEPVSSYFMLPIIFRIRE